MKLKTLLASSFLTFAMAGGASLIPAQAEEPDTDSMGWRKERGMMMRRGPMGPGMGMMGHGMGMMWDHEKGPSFMEGRIAFLKAELGITGDQQKVWDAYAEALKKNIQSFRGIRDAMAKIWQAKSPVERLDARISFMETRLTALKELKAPLGALYASLSDEQKKTADGILTGMGHMW